ncbi:RHS repeat-associated core domain-containing protein [Pinirhizobacter soli]|uniref:RHS repeat-associated core domain-containing protein n=1 Tax=Pinirhizobacter soli TaxID=2786953 RepID=UPI00254634D2|nr:RHS repeat-associated core domain-containing protein [Pinirhizobacter soli]
MNRVLTAFVVGFILLWEFSSSEARDIYVDIGLKTCTTLNPSTSFPGGVGYYPSQTSCTPTLTLVSVPDDNISPQGGGSLHVGQNGAPAARPQDSQNVCAVLGSVKQGEPVDMSTGTKTEAITEFKLADEFGLEFSRYYVSNLMGVPNGSWRSSIDHQLIGTVCAAGKVCRNVQYLAPDGAVVNFQLITAITGAAGGTQVTGPFYNTGGTALGYYNGTYTMTGEDSATYSFDVNGDVTKIIKYTGLSWTFARPNANTVIVTHTTGRSFTVATTYSGTSATINVTDPAGQVYTYSSTTTTNSVAYGSSLHQINAVTYPGTPASIIQYKYTTAVPGADNVLSETDYNNVPHDLTNYDGSGRAIQTSMADGTQVDKFAYSLNSVGPVTTHTNPLGLVTTYQFNGAKKMLSASGAATASCAATYASVQYDGYGYLAQTTDNNGNVTKYAYLSNGQLSTLTEALGTSSERITRYTWDSGVGVNRILTTQIDGYSSTSASYDNHSHLASMSVKNLTNNGTNGQILTTNYTYVYYPSSFLMQTFTVSPPGGIGKVTYSYDTLGNLTKVSDGLGNSTTYSNFTGLGSPQTITSQNGDVTTLSYDARGRIQSLVHVYNATNTASYTYGANGLISDYVQLDGQRYHFDYDSALRVTAKTWYGQSGAKTLHQYTYDANGDVTRDAIFQNGATYAQRSIYFDYDELGRRIKTRENAGQWQAFTYDSNGNAKTVSTYDGTRSLTYDALNRIASSIDGKGGVTSYRYDLGNQIAQISDPRGLITSYVTDGLRIARTLYSPDTGTTTYVHDSNGILSSVTKNNGATISLSHDAIGRITKSIADSVTRTYNYDSCAYGLGHLCSYTDGDTSVSFVYDKAGNVKQRLTTDYRGTSTDSFLYDGAARMSWFSHGPYAVLYTRTDGYISKIDVAFGGQTYNVVQNATYDGSGMPSSLTYGNGLVRAWGRDTDGHLKTLTTDVPGGANLQYLAYGWDYSDRLTIIDDYHVSAQSQHYAYDAVNRLTQVTTGVVPLSVQYDSNGNRVQQITFSAENLVIDADSNRAMSRGAHAYTYDPIGDRATNTIGGSTVAYTYDSYGHMIAALRSASASYCEGNGTCPTYPAGQSYYYYDAFGLRTRKSTPIESVNYDYLLDGTLIGETSSATGSNFYIYLGGQVVGVVHTGPGSSTSNLYYAHADHLGRPQVITDSSAQPVWTADNLPFDRAITLPSLPGVDIGLPGQVYDRENGTWNNRARDYDATEGRYLQPDPIGLVGGINPYTYADGSPTTVTDPSGRITWTGTVTGGTLAAGVGGSVYLFDLYSECVGGSRAHASVTAVGPTAGLNLLVLPLPPVAAASSNITLHDRLGYVDPEVLSGWFAIYSAGVTVGRGVSATAIQLGGRAGFSSAPEDSGAISDLSIGEEGGLDIGAGATAGTATVEGNETTTCGCGK